MKKHKGKKRNEKKVQGRKIYKRNNQLMKEGRKEGRKKVKNAQCSSNDKENERMQREGEV